MSATTVAALPECPDCGGDGFTVEFRGPGREYMYSFIPDEVHHRCENCGGHGFIQPEPEPVGGDHSAPQ